MQGDANQSPLHSNQDPPYSNQFRSVIYRQTTRRTAGGASPIAPSSKGVIRDAIAVLTEEGSPIPSPRPQPTYSGQLRLRMPKSLHQAMAARADQEGVSLNTLALTYLFLGVGR